MKSLLPVKKIITPIFKFILFLLIIFFTSKIEARAKLNLPDTIKWVFDTTVNGVSFYHIITPCSGKNVVFLKLVNSNRNAVKASWKELFKTKQEKQKIEGYKGLKQITLRRGETIEATCDNPRYIELSIQPSEVNPTFLALIENFNYTQVKVSRIN